MHCFARTLPGTFRTFAHLLVLVVIAGAGLLPGCNKSDSPQGPPSPDESSRLAARTEPATRSTVARDILSETASVYRNAKTYADQGTVHMELVIDGRKDDQTFSFAVALERPNRLRLDVYRTVVACDGQRFRATIEGLSNQALDKEAPDQLTMQRVYADPLLSEVINREFAGGPPQLLLLLEENALAMLLQDGAEPKLLEPGTIANRACHRVAVDRPEGTGVFWIDQGAHVVRRFEFPVEELRKQLSSQGKVEKLSLTAEFKGAAINAPIAAERFQLELPSGAEKVQFLVPPEPGALLGKKVPDFKFLDLDGKPVIPETLADKTVVLKFWAIPCEPCRQTFPALEKVYQKYKDNPKFVFLAVSVDPATTSNDALRETLQKLGATMPIVRDRDGALQKVFMTYGIPAMFILGGDGLLQHFEIGVNSDLEKQLPNMLEQLALGRSIYEDGQRQYQERLKKIETSAAGQGEAAIVQPPRAEIAPASKPTKFTLTSLWRATGLKGAGNLVTVPDPTGCKIYVIDQWRSIGEIDAQGKLVTSHTPEIPPEEVLCLLRTAVGPDGKRYFLGWTPFQQQIHVFDQEWKSVVHFPADALENKHAGVTDARLAPAQPGEKPELLVSYWGPVGVQRASMDGKRVWANRSLENVFCMVLSDPDPSGSPRLLCLTSRGLLVGLDLRGQRTGEFPVSSRPMPIQTLVAADLDGDGKQEFCGLAQKEIGLYVAIGLSAEGKELWTYELPKGQPEFPVEQVAHGRLLEGSQGQWILAGPDGSIHVLGPDGKLVDSFHYGSAVAGLGVTRLNDRPVLLLASPQGVEALEVGK